VTSVVTFGFPKSSRIRHRRDFKETMDRGLKAVCPHVVLFGRVRAGDSSVPAGPRFGLVVSRKVGESVVRNRVKRRLRESFRVMRPALDADGGLRSLDLVVVARASAADLPSAQLAAALEACLQRLGRMLERAGR
jgi:ribonuclease P protein component